MDFIGALTAASQALGIVKDLREIDRDISQAELRLKMAELYGNLADVRIALADAQIELQARERRISDLTAQLEKTGSLMEVQGFKYDAIEGHPVGLPYCPTCEVKEGKLYRLIKRNDQYSVCANCKTSYNAAADGRVHAKASPVHTPPRKPWIDNF